MEAMMPRLALLLLALLTSLHATAAPRVWTLTGATLSDGAVATGYLIYDDATGRLVDWNLRVGGGRFTPHTHVPGNAVGNLVPTQTPPFLPYLYFYSTFADSRGLGRSLRIVPLARLDGNSATVAIDLLKSYDFYEDYYYVYDLREFTSGSLVLTALPPPITMVQVDEFYHPALRHYFITASAAEKQDLDTGVHPGWHRTGESFKAYAVGSSASGSINPVCRYYGNPPTGPDSHFYSAQVRECFDVLWIFKWLMETDSVFQIDLPDTATGVCPAGTIPVYRLWNQRDDSNHRYATKPSIKAQMLAAGYLAEGYGPDGVVMCALQ
jgi:hypothetical protein